MEFEEMKVIWQKDQPMYAIDRQELHRRVKRYGATVANWVNAAEGIFIMTFLVMAILVGSEPLLEGHDWHQIFDAAVYLIVTGYLIRGVMRRRQCERQFDASLKGDLDKAISQVDHHIDRWQSLAWWCLLPLALTTLLSFVLLHDAKPMWLWLVVIFSLAFTYYASRREISCKLTPKKRDLEALRELLVDDEQRR